jgi:hypothetical protein
VERAMTAAIACTSFVLVFGALTLARYFFEKKFDVSLKDAAVAMIPAAIILISTGTVAKIALESIGFTYERVEAAIVGASNLEVSTIAERRPIIFARDALAAIEDPSMFEADATRVATIAKVEQNNALSEDEKGIAINKAVEDFFAAENIFMDSVRNKVSGRDLVIRIGDSALWNLKEKFYMRYLINAAGGDSDKFPGGNDIVFIDSNDGFIAACMASLARRTFDKCKDDYTCYLDSRLFEKMESRYEMIQYLSEINRRYMTCDLEEVALKETDTIGQAIEMFDRHEIDSIPIVDSRGQYFGRADSVEAIDKAVLELLRAVQSRK